MRLSALLLLLVVTAAHASETPDDLIAALFKAPWPVYPGLPSFSETMRAEIAGEIAQSEVIKAAFKELNPQNDITQWLSAVNKLENARAVWGLQACLCHPHSDVQVEALGALARLKDPRSVHFIILYAEYMAVEVAGSESATVHGIRQYTIAKTMSSITGIQNSYYRDSREKLMQNTNELKRAIRDWRRWELDHSKV